MDEIPNERSKREKTSRQGLSTIGAIAAAAAAVVLAFLFYDLVGFPKNIPLAMGAAVLLADVVESVAWVGAGTFNGVRLLRALMHGIIVAGASWLGVWVARLLGWTA